jgi:hypothetical protein
MKRLDYPHTIAVMSLIFTVIIIALVFIGTNRFYSNVNGKQITIVQHAVESAAIQCFALEGAFPPNLEYLEQHYGLKLDRQRYIYDYNVFASNIKPEINIFSK